MLKKLFHKITNQWRKLRLAPIPVFVFHQVSDEYNPLTMWECDWTQTEQFKRNILALKEKYTFISLTEAYEKLQHDWFRCKHYAVLTADDGYLSLMNVLPWLEEQHVPITLFINAKYMDKQSCAEGYIQLAKEKGCLVEEMQEMIEQLYLSEEQVMSLTSPFVEIGLHGYEHLDATKCTYEEFEKNVTDCEVTLKSHPRYVPFMAYTWGRHNAQADMILVDKNIIPVLVAGAVNYNYTIGIERQVLDGKNYE